MPGTRHPRFRFAIRRRRRWERWSRCSAQPGLLSPPEGRRRRAGPEKGRHLAQPRLRRFVGGAPSLGYAMVHTYDRGGHGYREHTGSDYSRRRRLAPGERLLRHQRPLDCLQSGRRHRQPPVLVSDQKRAPGGGLALPYRPLCRGAADRPQPAHRPPGGPGARRRVDLGVAPAAGRHPARGFRPSRPGTADGAPSRLPAGAVHALPRSHSRAARPPRGGRPNPAEGATGGPGPAGLEHCARLRALLRGHARRRILPARAISIQPAGRHSHRAGAMRAQAPVIGHELERLDGLWEDGLSDTYRSYLDVVVSYEEGAQPKLAMAAALIEAGLRLQGLGGRAAPAAALLMGDLCLARASRLIADTASQSLQVAFARAIEELSATAASGGAGKPVRELLVGALESGR